MVLKSTNNPVLLTDKIVLLSAAFNSFTMSY